MENNAQLEQGRFAFNDIHLYLRDSCYPDGYTKPDKLALQKRAKFFCTRGADLIYVGGSSFRLDPCLRPTPNYIASTHNIHTLHAHQHALRTQQYPLNCLPQPCYAHN